jgi:hypothetical protein
LGLCINLRKCTNQSDAKELFHASGCAVGSLPCTYLGLPLGIRKPTRADC